MTAEVLEEPTTSEREFLDTLLSLGTDRLFVHVELPRLKIDRRYQRVVNMQRVRRLAAAYDEDLMGVLVCSVREDGIFIIDGQHRYEVAKLLGMSTIRCELRVGLTLEQEANIFYNLDTARVGLNSDDSFRALLTANDPTALSVAATIEAVGLKVSLGGPVKGGVRAFKTIVNLTKQYGIERVRAALQVIAYAWHDIETPAPASVMEGMTHFLGYYPDINPRDLGHSLRTHTSPQKLNVDARALTGTLSWSTKRSMARAILAAYNKSRRAENRLPDLMVEEDENAETTASA